jgi:hypothetical protein
MPRSINTVDLLVVGSSSSIETDELDTGNDSDSEEQSRDLNSHATEQSQAESMDSEVDPAPIPTVGKRKRGRPSKEAIVPGDIIKIWLFLFSTNIAPLY